MTNPTVSELIEALSKPAAYPGDVDEVVVHQTHISVVFLAGDRAYKLKKPVDFGFVDYSTLERRHEFCRREVELNRRLAPSVYRGVVPVVRSEDGLAIDPDAGDDEAVEWAVEMIRLDDADTLKAKLAAGDVEPSWMEELGALVAEFHQGAERGPQVSEMASFEVVAKNALDNFSQSTDQVGVTIAEPVYHAFRQRTADLLAELRELIEARARRDVPRDTHGDLRLEHVYRVDEQLVIIDCIEFNDAFRYADPVADAAFMSMDLRFRWADDLADRFEDAYFAGTPDADEARRLLGFYVAYRSAVRGKVHGIRATEAEVPATDRRRAEQESAAHWLFGWSTLAPPLRRPAVLGVFGLPATGKSTLARELADVYGFEVVDSDVVRKELAGLSPEQSAADAPGAGIYTEEFSRRTYEECLSRAVELARQGGRVIVDATFRSNQWRVEFLTRARQSGVTGLLLECVLPRDVARERIERRTSGPSDADWKVYEHMEQAWDRPTDDVAPRIRTVETAARDGAMKSANRALAEFGLVEP